VIVVSTMNRPEVTELVTTGTLMVSASGDTRKVFAADSAQEFLPLWRAAFETDRGQSPAAGDKGSARLRVTKSR
jgi:hypothetical protein